MSIGDSYNDKFSFRVNTKFPSMNEIIACAKKGGNGMAYARLKKRYTREVIDVLEQTRIPFDCYKIYAVFTWCVANRRRDPDNIAVAVKFVFDAFVYAGLIKNDGQRTIDGWYNNFKKVSEPDYVDVDVYCQTTKEG